MNPADAARLLDLPTDATPEQLEARFHELRSKLEDKIAKAPTPGLKAKYRESLDEITTAFETLTLAADSSSLPVLQKQRTDDGGPRTAGGTTTPPHEPRSQSPVPKPPARKSGREFALVAIIAAVVLGAGGWWVMKTRAENQENARIAAEAKLAAERQAAAEKAEQERKTEEARVAAEAKRQAEEEAQITREAEKERLERVGASVAGQMAQLRLGWEAIEEDHRKAERRVSELRADERSFTSANQGNASPDLLRIRALLAAQTEFSDWLGSKVSRHPAKLLRAQVEALLSARQVDDAGRIAQQAAAEQENFDREISEMRQSILAIGGEVQLELAPATTQWTMTDSFGAQRSGTGSSRVDEVPFGSIELQVMQAGYRPRKIEGTLRRGEPLTLAHQFKPYPLTLTSIPKGAEVRVSGKEVGTTPINLDWAGDGRIAVEFQLANHETEKRVIELVGKAPAGPVHVRMKPRLNGVARPDISRGPRKFSVKQQTTGRSYSKDLKTGGLNYSLDHNYTSEEIYEATVDEFTGEWREVVVTVKSNVDNTKGINQVAPGTTYRWRRHNGDGRWTPVKDGVAQDPLNESGDYIHTPTAPIMMMDFAGCWPGHEITEVGQTWEISIKHLKGWLAYAIAAGPSVCTAKVVALRLEGVRREADLEISWQYAGTNKEKVGGLNATQNHKIDLKISVTVDLGRHYISRLSQSISNHYSIAVGGFLTGAASEAPTVLTASFVVTPIEEN